MQTLRMVLCILIGLLLILTSGNIGYIAPNASVLAISALSGVTTSIFVVRWLISVKKGAYMMLDVFLMLGVLVPMLSGSFFFNETITSTQWLGIGVLLIAGLIIINVL